MHTGWIFPPRAAHARFSAAEGCGSLGAAAGVSVDAMGVCASVVSSTGGGSNGSSDDGSLDETAAVAIGGDGVVAGTSAFEAVAGCGAGGDAQPHAAVTSTSRERNLMGPIVLCAGST